MDEMRALPGVDTVRVDLVPYGESLLTVAPAEAVSRAQVSSTLGHVGFEVVNRRRQSVHLGDGEPRLTAPAQDRPSRREDRRRTHETSCDRSA